MIRYFNNISNLFRSPIFMHDEHQFKHNIEMGIVSIPNTNMYIYKINRIYGKIDPPEYGR